METNEMCHTILIVLIGLGYAVSQEYAPYSGSSTGSPQNSDYRSHALSGQYGVSLGEDEIYKDINKLTKTISSLIDKDYEITHRLIESIDSSEANRLFTEEFYASIIPGIQKRQIDQSAELEKLYIRMFAILEVSNDAANITEFLSEADYQVKDLVAQNKEIQYIIDEIKKGNTEVLKKSNLFDSQIKEQEDKITTLEDGIDETRERLAQLRKVIDTVHDLTIDERESASFTFLLTDKEPVINNIAQYRGKNPPLVLYGVSNLKFTFDKGSVLVPNSDYGKYGNSSAGVPTDISYDIDVRFDNINKGLTAYLFDHSTNGWKVETATIKVVFVNIDDRTLHID